MKTMTDGSQENWSAERVKELTMSRITARNPVYAKARHPAMAIAACVVLVLTMSATALATNAFGIRDLVGNFLNWSVNEAAGVLELDTDGKTTMGRFTAEGTFEYEMTLKSMTLSPMELTFSYVFKSDYGKVPLPGLLAVRMSDGAIIDAEITGTTIDGDLLIGSARFPSAINLDEAVTVMFGGSTDAGGSIAGITIPVNSDASMHPVQGDGAEFSVTELPQG